MILQRTPTKRTTVNHRHVRLPHCQACFLACTAEQSDMQSQSEGSKVLHNSTGPAGRDMETTQHPGKCLSPAGLFATRCLQTAAAAVPALQHLPIASPRSIAGTAAVALPAEATAAAASAAAATATATWWLMPPGYPVHSRAGRRYVAGRCNQPEELRTIAKPICKRSRDLTCTATIFFTLKPVKMHPHGTTQRACLLPKTIWCKLSVALGVWQRNVQRCLA